MSLVTHSSTIKLAGNLARSSIVFTQNMSNRSQIFNPFSNNDSPSSGLVQTQREMSSGGKETWLQKFFTVDTTKTAHSDVVGSPNLYRLVYLSTIPERNVSGLNDIEIKE